VRVPDQSAATASGTLTAGSLTAGAAKLFNKALAAPRRNKIRPGAL
jgi:hypothetical protein